MIDKSLAVIAILAISAFVGLTFSSYAIALVLFLIGIAVLVWVYVT